MPVEVNGVEISEQEIEASIAGIKRHYAQAPQKPADDEMREMAINHLVDHTLIKEVSAKDESEITMDEVHAFYLSNQSQDLSKLAPENARSEVESRIRFGRIVNGVMSKAKEVTAEEAKSFYDSNPKAFIQPERIHAAHIVKQVNDGDEAAAKAAIDAVKASIDAGAVFEDVAKSESDCQEKGGDLGTFPRGQMVEGFESIVFAMKEGEISEPFLTPFGFHIAKLYKHYEEETVAFDDISERLVQDLSNRRRHAAMESYVTDLRKDATISVG